MTVAVEPTFVAFLMHSQTFVRGLRAILSLHSKPPIIPFGIVACTFSDLSRKAVYLGVILMLIGGGEKSKYNASHAIASV